MGLEVKQNPLEVKQLTPTQNQNLLDLGITPLGDQTIPTLEIQSAPPAVVTTKVEKEVEKKHEEETTKKDDTKNLEVVEKENKNNEQQKSPPKSPLPPGAKAVAESLRVIDFKVVASPSASSSSSGSPPKEK